LISTNGVAAINKKNTAICLAIILWAVLVANLWRFLPPDPDSVRAVSLYTEILKETTIVGVGFSSLTTTLGSYAIKRSSENPLIAALMVSLLKDAGVSSDTVVAVNASGSFPGFLLAALSATSALEIETYVIASIGSSTYGANIPGNTIADMLMKDSVRSLGFTLLAVTPGGSGDRGWELDEEELERVSQMLENSGIPFIRPNNLAEAIALRGYLFSGTGSALLVNIGGGHAAIGNDAELALMSGILKPEPDKVFQEAGLVQDFLAAGIPVIQILNINRLYESSGLVFDQSGNLLADGGILYRQKQLSPLVTLLPVLVAFILLAVNRYSRKNKRRG